ncbi:MAG: NahK/ErcS family hybrid sensor histidine kinase/response regulator, partial [Pseudomonadota bacterium]
SSGAMSAEWVTAGPFGLGWLRPEALFFDAGLSPLTHGVLWSLGLNTALLVVFSRRGVVALTEQIQARAFATTPLPTPPKPANVAGRVPLADLVALAGRFVGQQAAERAFSAFAADHGDALEANGAADRETVQFTERLLASAVGASSARFVMTTAMRKRGLELADVVLLLDETSQAIRFNRQLLENTLENMSQGVSVDDGAQSLIGWNSQYVSMMGFPEGMVEVGRPIADLIRYNAKRGCFRSSDVEHEISKRLGHLRSGSAYRYESTFIDGRVLEIRGKPLPDGGFVTTYSDITEYKRVEAELEESKLGLAKRVAERTAELEVAVRELDKARLVAESANASKTRFIAAAAHDLLQPLNAAKLFTALLVDAGDKNDAERQQLAERVEKGLTSVEELLSGLLDVARLDTNAPTPSLEHTAVADIFAQLEQQFRDSFERDGLSLRFVATKLWVHTDRALLRRILQNFISNARRYTNTGGVVVGCRRRGTDVAIQVVDTGVGVADEQSMQIFEEFSRGSSTRKAEKRGLGLGLSIVRRIAALLGHPIAMRSTVGRGSVFEIEVPRGRVQLAQPSPTAPAPPAFTSLSGQCVVCIDNDIDILDGMGALLRQWGATPVLAIDADEALDQLNHPGQLQRPSLLLVDYQLDNGVTGLAAIASVRAALGEDVPAVIVTANRSRSIRDAVADAGFRLINKPVKPAALRALISRLTHASRVAKAG